MKPLAKRSKLNIWAWCIGSLALVFACVGSQEQTNAPAFDVERFTQDGDGVVREVPARLEWAESDNGSEVNWHAAEEYCDELVTAGRSDWRLATIEELGALYDTEVESSCGEVTCHIAAPIKLSSRYQWSSTSRHQNRRVYIDFHFGARLAPRLRPNLTRRALCVRSELTSN